MIKKKAKNKVDTKEVVTEIVANTDKAVEDNKDDSRRGLQRYACNVL